MCLVLIFLQNMFLAKNLASKSVKIHNFKYLFSPTQMQCLESNVDFYKSQKMQNVHADILIEANILEIYF